METKVGRGTGEAVIASNSRFHHKVAGSSRERRDIGGVRQVVKDDTLCGNY